MPTHRQIKELRDRVGIGNSVAEELLILSGDDIDLAEQASRDSRGLDQCKANIIDRRFKRLVNIIADVSNGKVIEPLDQKE